MKKIRMKTSDMRAGWLISCLVLAACGTVEKPDPGHGGEEATSAATNTDASGEHRTEKPGAPVKIEGSLSGSNAAISVMFEADASDVSVEVWGVDGLVVTSAKQPLQGARFARGDKAPIDVSFTAPANRADLAVKVRGTFGGRVRERVQSFSVNASAPPATNAPGEVKLGPDGQPVRVMKAE